MKISFKANIASILLITFALSACNNNSDNKFSANIENKSCVSDTSIHYSLYAPKSNREKLPAIIFFDPHAQGSVPVKAYAKLASEYQYILLGSNDMHNGQSASQTEKIVLGLINEAVNQCNADGNRIYLCGFSGGGKVATMYGINIPEIKGVIACGGSVTPNTKPDSTFCFVGMVGDKDFNYIDMQQTLVTFSKMGVSFTSLVFDGKHEWPDANYFKDAFDALEINAMRTGFKPSDVDWLKTVYTKLKDSANICMATGDYVKCSELIGRIQGWFGSIDNDMRLSAFMSNLVNNQMYISEMEKKTGLAMKEIELRSKFIGSVESRDIDWWKNEVDNFHKSIASKDKQVSLTTQRLMAYLSMMAFSLANNDILSGNKEGALKKLQIYELVDPDLADVDLMFARYYLMTSEREKMAESFKKAISKGFDRVEQYASDPTWRQLYSQPEIKAELSGKNK